MVFKRFIFFAFCVFVGLNSCLEKKTELNSNEAAIHCMQSIIEADESLGKLRNHACENQSLSLTITDYTSQLQALNFKTCPEAFTKAFNQHIDAWKAMLVVTDRHPDLRGEMHELFDEIATTKDSVQFNEKLDAIWSTWSDIEDVMVIYHIK